MTTNQPSTETKKRERLTLKAEGKAKFEKRMKQWERHRNVTALLDAAKAFKP